MIGIIPSVTFWKIFIFAQACFWDFSHFDAVPVYSVLLCTLFLGISFTQFVFCSTTVHIFFLLLLEYSCFTMLCKFLMCDKMNQLYVHICRLLLEPIFHSPHPAPLGHHRALSRAPSARRQLHTSCLSYTWWCVYVSLNLPVHPALPVTSTHQLSLSVSLFLLRN